MHGYEGMSMNKKIFPPNLGHLVDIRIPLPVPELKVSMAIDEANISGVLFMPWILFEAIRDEINNLDGWI